MANQLAAEYAVRWNEVTRDQVTAFKQVLDSASNEAAIQTFLEANPQLPLRSRLTCVFAGLHGAGPGMPPKQ